MGAVQLTQDEVREQVREKVAELTELETSEVSDTALFIDELGIDSLMAIELMVALDKEYKIDIAEEEFREIKNVNESVDVIMRHLEQKEA